MSTVSEVSRENLLLLGKVLRPHGLDGRLRIRSYARSADSFLDRGAVFLQTESGETRAVRVQAVSPHKRLFLLKVAGLDTLEEAEQYRGALILVEKEASGPEEKEEFFWHELIGLRVSLEDGSYVGDLRNILATGAHDVYVVRNGDREVLIPAVHEVVRKIDLKQGTMTISWMEGLLDPDEV